VLNISPPSPPFPPPLTSQEVDEQELSIEEAKERKIMKLLLKVKNGTPPQRKAALRQLTDKARELGAGPLFNQILPLLMQVGHMRTVRERRGDDDDDEEEEEEEGG
jgi:hypothetical protein